MTSLKWLGRNLGDRAAAIRFRSLSGIFRSSFLACFAIRSVHAMEGLVQRDEFPSLDFSSRATDSGQVRPACTHDTNREIPFQRLSNQLRTAAVFALSHSLHFPDHVLRQRNGNGLVCCHAKILTYGATIPPQLHRRLLRRHFGERWQPQLGDVTSLSTTRQGMASAMPEGIGNFPYRTAVGPSEAVGGASCVERGNSEVAI